MGDDSWRSGPGRPPTPGTCVSDDNTPGFKAIDRDFQPTFAETWLRRKFALTEVWAHVVAMALGFNPEGRA
jgi:hypothetical protein